MLGIIKNQAFPIGVDVTDDSLRMVQMKNADEKGPLVLLAGNCQSCPPDILPGTPTWQRWAIDAMRNVCSKSKFAGRHVIASVPPSEVFIDHIKVPKSDSRDLDETIMTKAKQKLTGEFENSLVKYITTEEDNVVIIATGRVMIDRHLAIYEEAGLKIKSIGVWPLALVNAYVKFFGRRSTDRETVVMLVDTGVLRTNVVICRHQELLFARSIPVGTKLLKMGESTSRLMAEISACRQSFNTLYKKAKIERVIFMTGQAVDKDIYTSIAIQLQLPAQIGDCLSAVSIAEDNLLDMGKRNSQFSWATAFGLSLS